MGNIDITNEDTRNINLAINYMVIEKAAKIMKLDKEIYAEEDFIESVFRWASNFELADILISSTQKDENFLPQYVQKLSTLFDLPEDVLLGNRQINLGISVSKQFYDAAYKNDKELKEQDKNNIDGIVSPLSYPEYIETYIEENSCKSKTSSKITELNSIADDVNATIHQGIGSFTNTKYYKDKKDILLALSSNPIGINNLSLFLKLYEKYYEDFDSYDEDFEDELGDIFTKIFCPMKIVERSIGGINILQPAANSIGQWQENIYSLSSIITNILVNENDAIVSENDWDDNILSLIDDDMINKYRKITADKNYKHILGKDLSIIPEGNQTEAEYEEQRKKLEAIKAIDKHLYFDKCKNYYPYPLVMDKQSSELFKLIISLYRNFGDHIQVEDLKYITTIEEELEYWKNQKEWAISVIPNDESKIELWLQTPQNQKTYSRLEWIVDSYIPALEEAQRLYETDPMKWSVAYTELLQKYYKELSFRYTDAQQQFGEDDSRTVKLLNQKISCQNLSKKHLEMRQKEKKAEALDRKKKAKTARRTKIRPYILTKEPHLEEKSYCDYNNGKQRKNKGSRKYTNNYIEFSSEKGTH